MLSLTYSIRRNSCFLSNTFNIFIITYGITAILFWRKNSDWFFTPNLLLDVLAFQFYFCGFFALRNHSLPVSSSLEESVPAKMSRTDRIKLREWLKPRSNSIENGFVLSTETIAMSNDAPSGGERPLCKPTTTRVSSNGKSD